MEKEEPYEGRYHEHELEIAAPKDAVWKAITSADELVRWFPLAAEVEPGEGGTITLDWGPDMRGACEIRVWEPGTHLRTAWVEVAAPDTEDAAARGRIVVDWRLEARGGRTWLRLVHSGFGEGAEWDLEYDGTNRGWEFELRSLRHYLEHHRGRERRAFWLRRPVEDDAAAAWRRFTGAIVAAGELEGLGAGDRYAIRLSSGDALEGEVWIDQPPRDFCGTVANLANGVFRYGFDRLPGPEAHLWLSTWGLPASEVQALEARWRRALDGAYSSST
jgi:uncharacterized protein YndB with AHSA1/START domain